MLAPERHGFYDKEFSYLEMVQGNEVICIYWDFGKLKGYKGILEEVNFYDNIIVEGKNIKFLGERTAIKYIIYDERIVLYSNSNIDDYTGHIGHFHDLIKLQKQKLGYSVIDEKLQHHLSKKRLKIFEKYK